MKLLILVILSSCLFGCATPDFIASRTGGIQVHPARFIGAVGEGISDGSRNIGSTSHTVCEVNGFGQLVPPGCVQNGR